MHLTRLISRFRVLCLVNLKASRVGHSSSYQPHLVRHVPPLIASCFNHNLIELSHKCLHPISAVHFSDFSGTSSSSSSKRLGVIEVNQKSFHFSIFQLASESAALTGCVHVSDAAWWRDQSDFHATNNPPVKSSEEWPWPGIYRSYPSVHFPATDTSSYTQQK